MFSEFLLSQLRPSKFVAFDLFTMHEFTTSWAGRTNMFGNMTQLEHYRRKFADRGSQVVIEAGMSQQNLAKYPDKSFNLIYIDGDHSYASVKQDTDLAKIKQTVWKVGLSGFRRSVGRGRIRHDVHHWSRPLAASAFAGGRG